MYGDRTESSTNIEVFTDGVSSTPPSPSLKRPRMQSMRDEILSSLRASAYNIKRADETLMNDVSFIQEAVGINGMLLAHFDKEYKANRNLVITAVRQNGRALEHADVHLRDDKTIVKLAVEKDYTAIQFASFNTTCDPDIYHVALQQWGGALKLLPNRLKRDKDVVRMVVEGYGSALEYADPTLRQDKDIVLAAVKQTGFALKHAGDTLRHDEDVVRAAVQQNGHVLQDVDEPLKSRKDIVLEAVRADGLALKHSRKKDPAGRLMERHTGANVSYVADTDVVLAAVKQDGNALKYAHQSMRASRAIVLAAVKQHGLAIMYADESLRGDVSVALAAVGQDGTSILYLHRKLLSDSHFLMEAVKRDGMALCILADHSEIELVHPHINYSDWSTIKDIAGEFLINMFKMKPDYNEMLVRAALENNGYALMFAGDDFRHDREMVLLATRQTWRALALADKEFWNDSQCLQAAISQLPKGDIRSDHLKDECVFTLLNQNTTKILREGVWGMTVQEIETKLTRETGAFRTVRIVDEGATLPMKKYMIPYPPLELCQELYLHGVDVRFPVPSVLIGQGVERRDIYDSPFARQAVG
jgi:hypothetical protein